MDVAIIEIELRVLERRLRSLNLRLVDRDGVSLRLESSSETARSSVIDEYIFSCVAARSSAALVSASWAFAELSCA
jgi:hypothetical protein